MSILSDRVKQVKPSPTMAITAKAKELRAQGRDVIGLGAGEPDFTTPPHVKKAGIKAIKENFTYYTAAGGIPELKQAIARKFKKDNGLKYETSEITVNVGGKHSFYNLAQATMNPGDEVIIPAPYWVSYPDMTTLAGATPVIVQAGKETRFKMTAEQLEAAITPKTKWVVINSPSNPTGSAYSKKDLKALGAVLLKHPHVHVISDDIYETITYDGFKFCNIVMAVPELKERTMLLNGVSKAYSMTGWRIGYVAGPAEIIKAMEKVQSQSTSNPCSIAQMAAITALTGKQKFLKSWVKDYKKRRDFVVKSLNTMDGVTCLTPEGAFYVYPNIDGLVGKKTPGGQEIKESSDLAAYLLDDYGVAMVPGVAFGLEPYFRVSYATSMENLKSAMKRIAKAVKKLS